MQPSLFDSETTETSQTSTGDPLLEHLNPQQRAAVVHDQGPLLVIAGAGSGKTRTLVHRVAHLIKKGVQPNKILLLTFTRRSAQEMLERASLLLDGSCRDVNGGTFHAVANSLLRKYGYVLGFSPRFTVLDRSDSEGIINLLKSSLNLSGAGKKFPSKRMIIQSISQSVNKSISYEDLLHDKYWHLVEFLDDLLLIREHYERFKSEHDLMDYDDLLVCLRRLLGEFPDIQSEIADKFDYIMVDEYQDTNRLQAEIIRLLTLHHQNIMAVGDDSQSIYSFRGADFKNIMDFPNIFTNARLIRLEENYRSSQPILTMTNAIIANAAEKYSKNLFTNRKGGEFPRLYAARNESEQAAFVARQIDDALHSGTSPDEIAVLFRSGFHSYKLELELTNRQIAFEKRGGMKLTESAHIKDVLSYLRVTSNLYDNLSWNRLFLLIEKVGPKTAQNFINIMKGSEHPFDALRDFVRGKKWQQAIGELCDVLEALQDGTMAPIDQFEKAMEHYQPHFERVYHDDYPTRSRDLEQLKSIIEGYESLELFLADTSLDPPESSVGSQQDSRFGHPQSIILSTVHSAKGLEWDHVFVIHLTEGKFPSSMAQDSHEIEEERRLFYVASTRAKNHLTLVYPQETSSYNRYSEAGGISRFLSELPPGVTRTDRGVASQPIAVGSAFVKKPTVKSQGVAENVRVRHPFFGEGRIQKKLGARTVLIHFNRHGAKVINLDYAKIEVLG